MEDSLILLKQDVSMVLQAMYTENQY